MDPTNNQNPVLATPAEPTVNSAETAAAPVASTAPEAPAEPVAPAPAEVVTNPAAAAAPILNAATEATPVADADLQQVEAAMEAVTPEPSAPAGPAPAQAISTAMPATESLATPPVEAAPAVEPAPVAPVPDLASPLGDATAFQASVGGMVAATDPITMPSPPAEQDPVEAELEAPIKAADPVPGSIGSAISVPAEGGNVQPQQTTPSVAFNDPAVANMSQQNANPATKKPAFLANLKMNKTTLILLCVVAGLIVFALVVVLILQLNG